jgi:hypothetical protein
MIAFGSSDVALTGSQQTRNQTSMASSEADARVIEAGLERRQRRFGLRIIGFDAAAIEDRLAKDGNLASFIDYCLLCCRLADRNGIGVCCALQKPFMGSLASWPLSRLATNVACVLLKAPLFSLSA